MKYHLGYRTVRKLADGEVEIRLSANPSHLEAVAPVVEVRQLTVFGQARAAFAVAVGELVAQLPRGVVPDVIVHASSSGGTQAGLTAGCALHGLPTRVIGISADDPASSIETVVRGIISGLGAMIGVDGDTLARGVQVTVDDSFVGEGYTVPTAASREAQSLAARTEALFVDHTYTAKALAALIAYVRDGQFRAGDTIVFWHTGGQVGLFT